jgi:exopolyphosphatase / guanosine-5'-triphosphate,3'-diphosphate pyrophosphatase
MDKNILIDLGTNSALLSCVFIKNNSLIITYDKSITTRIGRLKEIKKKTLDKTINILEKELKNLDYKKIGIATAGFRSAKNGKLSLNKINKTLASKINIISGKEEASLSKISTDYLSYDKRKNYIICDIGGGSTELIFKVKGKVKKTISLNIGAIEIENKFNLYNGKNLKEARSFIFKNFPILKESFNTLIVCGGTGTTIGAYKLNLKTYDPKRVENLKIEKEEIRKILNKFYKSQKKELINLLSFNKKRASIITSGTLILDSINKFYNIKEDIITTMGPRYGHFLKNKKIKIKKIEYRL